VSPAPAGRRRGVTNLHLIPAGAETAFRVAKDRYGALSAHRYPPIDGPAPHLRGRYETTGSTLYFANSRECAYGEVLTGFRQERGALAADAEAAGYELSEWVDLVTAQAVAHELDPPWAVSGDWQMARSIYEVDLPENGWWVRIDHSDTLNALVDQYPHRDIRANPVLTLGDLEGEDRTLTTLLAQHIRSLLLDDGSKALGIDFPSKTGYGRCWAFWDRRTDLGLGRGTNDPRQVTSDNVGPDSAVIRVAGELGLPILPGHRL
jgi:hypothetical protein